ncbi:MAG: hypothetical protein AAF662_06790 [Pseudomonadota bacterium]
MPEFDDAHAALERAAAALNAVAAELSAAGAEPVPTVSLGTISVTGVLVSLSSFLAGFFLSRYFEQKDARVRRALEAHERFNARETVDDRNDAAACALLHIGQSFDVIGAEHRTGRRAIYRVAREYEVLWMQVKLKKIDPEIIRAHFFEIFMYWHQFYIYGFDGSEYTVKASVDALHDWFKTEVSAEYYAEIQKKQRDLINKDLAKTNQFFDFTTHRLSTIVDAAD